MLFFFIHCALPLHHTAIVVACLCAYAHVIDIIARTYQVGTFSHVHPFCVYCALVVVCLLHAYT